MPDRYLIIVEAPPERGTVKRDVRQRIGQWLKIGLRGFNLRAVDVREQKEQEHGEAIHGQEPSGGEVPRHRAGEVR